MAAYGGAHYSDQQVAIIVLLSVLTPLTIAIVSLRCSIRIWVKHAYGWDDTCIILGTISATVGAALELVSVYYGTGQNVMALPNPDYQIPKAVEFNTAYQIINIVGTCFARLSILCLLLRLQSKRSYKWAIWVFIILMVITSIATVGVLGGQCVPLKKLWYPNTSGHCLPRSSAYDGSYAQSAVAISTDLFCTVSPVVILWGLKMSHRKKVGICFLMSLGLIASVCNALRNYYLPELTSADVTDNTGIVITTILEFYIGLIAACIPVVVPIIQHEKVKKWLSTHATASVFHVSGVVHVAPLTKQDSRPYRRQSSSDNLYEMAPPSIREALQRNQIVETTSYTVERHTESRPSGSLEDYERSKADTYNFHLK